MSISPLDIGPEQNFEAAATLAEWLRRFVILVTTWAVCGCYELEFGGEHMRYCSWEESTMYRMEFVIKSDEFRLEFTEGVVYRYLDAVEQGFCEKAIEHARGTRKVSWGKAILHVMSTNVSIWQEK